jgi:hypothetical protein
VFPAEFKELNMKKRSILKMLLATTLVCAFVAIGGENTAVKGNKNSKIYHKPACKHYTAKGSTETFASEDEAKGAGYKACKKCGDAEKQDMSAK